MNPQSLIFLRLVESSVGSVPAERSTEFQFAIGEGDMIGFAFGVFITIVGKWAWNRLSSRPVLWASRRGLRVVDLDDEPERIAEIRPVVLTPVNFVHAIPEDWGELDPC